MFSMKKTIQIILGTILSIHFFIVILQLLPNNPLATKYGKVITRYMSPYFSQSWEMFTPPVNSNRVVIFEFVTYSKGKADTVKRDATTSLIEESKKKSSAIIRISDFLSWNISGLYQLNNVLLDSIEKNKKLNSDSVAKENFFYRKMEKSLFFQDLYKYSKKCFYKVYTIPQLQLIDSAFVTISIMNREFPDFENRYADYNDINNYKISCWNSRPKKLDLSRYY